MPNTLEGFLIVAGLGLFVFSLFNGAVSIYDINFSALGRKGRVTLMILGPLLMLVGGCLYINSNPSLLKFFNEDPCNVPWQKKHYRATCNVISVLVLFLSFGSQANSSCANLKEAGEAY